ncbi:MAG: FHA domain-containing protein [Planctomycetaceae bacterium]|nr:FHA domain-containing protein [Planctomycetales bacterium]MCB9924095.1 FHA domain-containing protein [Planctomycetaceae bacterium]
MQVKLKVLAGKNSGRELPVPVKRFLIGRGDDCHMRPKSEAISRNHCAILINEEDDEVVIRDLNSRNGTYLNGERLAADQSLESGDHLQIGRLEFEVIIKDRKRVPEPVAAPVSRDESSASLDFDISEWLHEADAGEKASKKSDPETRQFKLDETDRIALEAAKQTLDSVEGIDLPDSTPHESGTKKFERPKKQAPGKLPESSKAAAASSRDAAADMLKKFFNNR